MGNSLATISDVANRAGVSMKTVSRVLNNEAHVRPQLQERVLQAVAELDYKPNLAARQLAANRSFLISLIMYDASASYGAQIIVATATECRGLGYHLVTELIGAEERGAEVVKRVVARLRPEGIILPPPLCNDPEVVDAVARVGVPLARLAGVGDLYGTAVRPDDAPVSRELVRHLIDSGHRRIGMITPRWRNGAAWGRVEGYRQALAEADIAFDPMLEVSGDFTFAGGAMGAAQLLGRAKRPTALFATNDAMALGAMAVARRDGLDVPRDLAVAGFDDTPAGRMVFPALTTVRQPFDAMAQMAVAAILGRDLSVALLKHTLILRASTTGTSSDLLQVDS